jgi:putative transposase
LTNVPEVLRRAALHDVTFCRRLKFGPLFAKELRRRRHRPTSHWHLDEMAVLIAGRRFWVWRAVDAEGEVLDLLVQRRRDKTAAMKLMR